mgnify:CR=1 FL=1
MAVCPGFLALGATTGGVYCFTRADLKFVQIIQPPREGSVCALQFSRDGGYIAVASAKGFVAVWEHNLDNIRERAKRVKMYEHPHGPIACMQWSDTGERLFVGEEGY